MCNSGECEETADYTGVKCTDYENNTECGGEGSGWYCDFTPKNCSASGAGTCTAISGGTEITPAGDPTKTYLKSPDAMDWWSAYSWCKGNGVEPVAGTIAGKPLNSYYENWAGNGLLYQYFGGEISFWTGHDYGDSCTAWNVDVNSGDEFVSDGDRHYGTFYSALCQ